MIIYILFVDTSSVVCGYQYIRDLFTTIDWNQINFLIIMIIREFCESNTI